MMENPLLETIYSHRLSATPFHLIKTEHFKPALELSLKSAYEEVDKIRKSIEPPTFENTILAMDFAQERIEFVTNVYFNLFNAESDAKFRALAQEITKSIAEFENSLFTDEEIFSKVKKIYEIECLNKEKPIPDFNDEKNMELCERYRYTEKIYKSFIRNGVMLSPDDKVILREIDRELSALRPVFSNNVADGTNAFELYVTDENDVEGIPPNILEEAANRARQKGKDKGWLLTLQISCLMPVITHCKNRKTREVMQTAYASRNYNDSFDNQYIVRRILDLRYQRAVLLGYQTYAHYVLEERMLQRPEYVYDFMEKIYAMYYPLAKAEYEEVISYAKESDGITDFKFWDFNYYAAKLKEEQYQLDLEQLRPWFRYEAVLDGMFQLAGQLFSVKISQVYDVPVYNSDVTTWEVHDKNGNYLGLMYLDMFPRPTKRGGAWMNTLMDQGLYSDGMKRPHVIVAASLSPSQDGTPSLLSFDEIRILFYQFGYALHSLLSKCHYRNLSGHKVLWDFLELPSQVMIKLLGEKDVLRTLSRHYIKGECLSDSVLEKILEEREFLVNNNILGQLRFASLDLDLHVVNPATIEDIDDFENASIEKYRILPITQGSNITCQFSHIFASGYAVGFYSYLWGEILGDEVWSLAKENGFIDDKVLHNFRDIVLSHGNAVHPMDMLLALKGNHSNQSSFIITDNS